MEVERERNTEKTKRRVLSFHHELTLSASAARLRSRMPSFAPATSAMNFLVSRPREESYRQPPGWGAGEAVMRMDREVRQADEKKKKKKTGKAKRKDRNVSGGHDCPRNRHDGAPAPPLACAKINNPRLGVQMRGAEGVEWQATAGDRARAYSWSRAPLQGTKRARKSRRARASRPPPSLPPAASTVPPTPFPAL